HAPGATDGVALLNFHMGAGRPDPDANGEVTSASSVAGAVLEKGPGGGVMVYVPLTASDHADCQGPFAKLGNGLGDAPACSGNDVAVGLQGKIVNEWYAVAVGYTDDAAGGDALATDITTGQPVVRPTKSSPTPVPSSTHGERRHRKAPRSAATTRRKCGA